MQKLTTPFEHYDITARRMASPGILLMTGKQGNPMTIGWAQLGVIWGKPVFTVLVRPSRHSHDLLEELGEFSVNVLPGDMKKPLGICGSRSGRDLDKIAECGLNLIPGREISVPSCGESELIYECRVTASQDLIPSALHTREVKDFYPQGDLHTLYYGEIAAVYGSL